MLFRSDANDADGDGCRADCTTACPNGLVDPNAGCPTLAGGACEELPESCGPADLSCTMDVAALRRTVAFLADPSPSKRLAAIDRLLADPDWTRTQARLFRDVILYRRTDPRAAGLAAPLEDFLVARLAGAASWGEIARDLIAATGAPGEHGETAIVMAQMGETSDIAAEVSRIFLGIQLQCAQCHDHVTDRWKREQFHEFAAYFPRILIRPTGGQGIDRFEVVSFDRDPRRQRGKNPDNPRRGDQIGRAHV